MLKPSFIFVHLRGVFIMYGMYSRELRWTVLKIMVILILSICKIPKLMDALLTFQSRSFSIYLPKIFYDLLYTMKKKKKNLVVLIFKAGSGMMECHLRQHRFFLIDFLFGEKQILMPWQLEPDNQVWGYVWPLRNTGRKTDLHQICSEQVDATKVQTRRKSLTKMVTASFAP